MGHYREYLPRVLIPEGSLCRVMKLMFYCIIKHKGLFSRGQNRQNLTLLDLLAPIAASRRGLFFAQCLYNSPPCTSSVSKRDVYLEVIPILSSLVCQPECIEDGRGGMEKSLFRIQESSCVKERKAAINADNNTNERRFICYVFSN